MDGILKRRLEQGPLLVAEGYLFEMERRGYVKAGPFVPEVVLDYPDALRELHREFLRAGSDVMVAFTYYAHRDKVKSVGRERDLEKLNRQALRIAGDVADEANALVAGNICNTWVYDPNNQNTWKEVYEMYDEQVKWAKEEGADYIIAETLFYLGEAYIALEIIKKHGLEAVITFAPFHSKTLDGWGFPEACRALESEGASVVGLNCGTGPWLMLDIIKKIQEKVSCKVACLPVPYRTDENHPNFQKLKTKSGEQAFPVMLEEHLLNRKETAEFALEAQKAGVGYLGLCCGGAPHFIRSMAESLARRPQASKYSPNMDNHAMLGKNAREHNIKYISDWKS
ncbi:MAG: homocysteine S-methyltransferase family protein [Nanoarchaeota archaeon]